MLGKWGRWNGVVVVLNGMLKLSHSSKQEIVAPRSPTFTSSTSNSSSISGHGMQTSTSTSSFISSTSASSSSTAATAVATMQIGDQKISVPLLATAGVSIFVLTLVFRALYTFGTSLLRLFVLVVFVVAALSFSSFSEKQQQSAHRKRAVEAALNGERSHCTNEYAAEDRRIPSSTSSYQPATTSIASPYSQAAASTAPLTLKSQTSYGHAKYNSAYSTKTTIATTTATTNQTSAPIYSLDGSRSRQLLTAHQRSPTYA